MPLCLPLPLPQALLSMPGGLCELLRSLHVQGLKNDEVLLLKDTRRLAEHKDSGPQVVTDLSDCRNVLSQHVVVKRK